MKITSLLMAKVLLRREVAIAMLRSVDSDAATFTLTLDEMMNMPDELVVPFAIYGQTLMEDLGEDGIKRSLSSLMVKISRCYEYDNWREALETPIVYDEDHVIVPSRYVHF